MNFDSSIQIPLPPLVENENDRRALATTFHYTRERYRQFRTKLSTELQQSKGALQNQSISLPSFRTCEYFYLDLRYFHS